MVVLLEVLAGDAVGAPGAVLLLSVVVAAVAVAVLAGVARCGLVGGRPIGRVRMGLCLMKRLSVVAGLMMTPPAIVGSIVVLGAPLVRGLPVMVELFMGVRLTFRRGPTVVGKVTGGVKPTVAAGPPRGVVGSTVESPATLLALIIEVLSIGMLGEDSVLGSRRDGECGALGSAMTRGVAAGVAVRIVGDGPIGGVLEFTVVVGCPITEMGCVRVIGHPTVMRPVMTATWPAVRGWCAEVRGHVQVIGVCLGWSLFGR